MFTITLNDEQVYRRLLARAQAQNATMDDVLRALLSGNGDHEPDASDAPTDEETAETPEQRLVRLIREADVQFPNGIQGRDVKDFIRREAGTITWRSQEDDHGTT